jgi:hypothetical protein
MAASALGVAYAAISAYWGLGGKWLLDTVGASLATGHSDAALTAVWAAVVLKAAGVVIPPLACRPGPTRPNRRLRALGWVEGAILTVYGLVLTSTGLLVQAGAISAGRTADRRALAWHAYLWDPWFLAWGLLVLAGLSLTQRRPGASGTQRLDSTVTE